MRQGLKLGILTYVHFFVDFACAFWVNYIILEDGTRIDLRDLMLCVDSHYVISNGNILFWVMLYNFCAFALQLPLGMLLDRLHQKKPWWMAAFGCALIGIAGVVGNISRHYMLPQMISMSLLLGIGNALFHVGAGVRVLQMGERMTPLGIFVSTGAFGICLGSIFCSIYTSANANPYEYNRLSEYRGHHWDEGIMGGLLLIVTLLSFTAALVLLLGSKMDSLKTDVRKGGQMDSSQISVHKNGQMDFVNAVSIVLLFLVVTLRSFQGSFVKFSWNTGVPIMLLFALCIVAGKALGGILADRFGVPVALIPLLLSALLFLKSEDMLPGLGAILLFQTTMPITLSLMHKQLPALPGTAFGLLSFALFVGYLPKFLSIYSGINVSGYRVVIGKWSFYKFSYIVAKWWLRMKWQGGVYVYSIVTVLSFILLVFLLSLQYNRKGE